MKFTIGWLKEHLDTKIQEMVFLELITVLNSRHGYLMEVFHPDKSTGKLKVLKKNFTQISQHIG